MEFRSPHPLKPNGVSGVKESWRGRSRADPATFHFKKTITLLRTAILAAVTILVYPPVSAQGQAAVTRTISVCVLSSGTLKEVPASYDTRTGDTLVTVSTGPVYFHAVYPNDANYAAGHAWYFKNNTLRHRGRRYRKYGLPRVLGTSEVARLSSTIGTVPLFVETGTVELPEVLYVPVRVGCEFQPYQLEPETRTH